MPEKSTLVTSQCSSSDLRNSRPHESAPDDDDLLDGRAGGGGRGEGPGGRGQAGREHGDEGIQVFRLQ